MITAALAVALIQPIEGVEHLARFHAGLNQLAAGGKARVRVTHFGDSHVAADQWTGFVRDGLQRAFGDGGRGFVLAGRPWASHGQRGLRASTRGRWRADGLRDGLDDGWYAPGGCSMASVDPDAVVRVGVPADHVGFTRVEVHYLRQPGGGCFTVRVDETEIQVSGDGPWVAPGVAAIDVRRAHSVEVRPHGRREVRILGVDLQRGGGVVYDALGINGAKARRLLRMDPELLGHGLQRLNPQLVVLSYGTNELYDLALDPERYRRTLNAVLTRLRDAAPASDCLVTGPPDLLRSGATPPLMETVQRLQRDLAQAHGCAFWDARAAMGGPGSMRQWMRAGLAQSDGVHLTPKGYQTLGERFLAALRANTEIPVKPTKN